MNLLDRLTAPGAKRILALDGMSKKERLFGMELLLLAIGILNDEQATATPTLDISLHISKSSSLQFPANSGVLSQRLCGIRSKPVHIMIAEPSDAL